MKNRNKIMEKMIEKGKHHISNIVNLNNTIDSKRTGENISHSILTFYMTVEPMIWLDTGEDTPMDEIVELVRGQGLKRLK